MVSSADMHHRLQCGTRSHLLTLHCNITGNTFSGTTPSTLTTPAIQEFQVPTLSIGGEVTPCVCNLPRGLTLNPTTGLVDKLTVAGTQSLMHAGHALQTHRVRVLDCSCRLLRGQGDVNTCTHSESLYSTPHQRSWMLWELQAREPCWQPHRIGKLFGSST